MNPTRKKLASLAIVAAIGVVATIAYAQCNPGNTMLLLGCLQDPVIQDAIIDEAMGEEMDDNPLNHQRYTDAEAVAAMGLEDDANALNHERYSDAEALDAMGMEMDNNPLNHEHPRQPRQVHHSGHGDRVWASESTQAARPGARARTARPFPSKARPFGLGDTIRSSDLRENG